MEHKGIQDWVTTFVKATNLSGLVCFDFLVDNNDNAYCIECNPRLHSAIVSFESQTKVIVQHNVFLSFDFNTRSKKRSKVNIEIILELITTLNNPLPDTQKKICKNQNRLNFSDFQTF